MSANQQPSPAWKRLAFYFRLREYGELVPHEFIAAILGFDYPSQPYYAHVQAAAKDQLKSKRHWALDRGQGYKLLFPHEIHLLAASHVSAARQSVQRGAEVLLHRDSARIPKSFDDDYRAGEEALSALCDQIECVEQTTRLVGGMKDVFARLKADAMRATRNYYDTKTRPDAGKNAKRSHTNWNGFVCQGCERLLFKHFGVNASADTGLEIVCSKCKTTNYLFGEEGGTTIGIDAESLGLMSSVSDHKRVAYPPARHFHRRKR